MKNKIALGLLALVAGGMILANSSAEARDFGRHNGWFQGNRGCDVHQSFNRQNFNRFQGSRFGQGNYFQNQRFARVDDRRFDNRWFANNPNRRYW